MTRKKYDSQDFIYLRGVLEDGVFKKKTGGEITMGKTAKSFYEKYLNGGYDYDGGYGLQCVDGARIWQDYFIGKSIPTSNGWASGYVLTDKQWFLDNGCEFISDYKQLKNGDLVIWDYGDTYHPYSHVAMYYNGFEFGMNQGGNGYFCLVSGHFSSMIGAYRSKECIDEVTTMYVTKGLNPIVSRPTMLQAEYTHGIKKRVKVYLNVRDKNSTNGKVLCTLSPTNNDYVMYFGYYSSDYDGTGKYWMWVNAYHYENGKYVKYTGFVRNDENFYYD